jgi:dipeptidyl aminopeptidase/acylaminoacyl peptidase
LIYSAFDESAASNLLYRVPVQGGKREVLPFAAPGLDLLGAFASVRGRRLVYVIPSNRWAIWRYALPGRGKTAPASRLIESTRVLADPRWSPSGSKFAFASIDSGTFQIYTANPDGSHQAQLTFMRGSMTGWPNWSPDGHRIAFDSRPEGHSQIFVVDAEGGTPRAMTPADQDSVMPEWSVDGEWIFYTVLASDGSSKIYKVPSRGGPVSTVFAGNAYGAFPSPDGTLLYFTNRTTGTMYRIPIAGGNPEEIGDFGRAGFLTIAKSGIYYLTPKRSAADRKPDLMCYRFATKRSEFVITLDQVPQSPALGVSRDESELLYATHGGTVSRIMLVENFR